MRLKLCHASGVMLNKACLLSHVGMFTWACLVRYAHSADFMCTVCYLISGVCMYWCGWIGKECGGAVNGGVYSS